MVISCISGSTFRRISVLLFAFTNSVLTLSAQCKLDTTGANAEFVHYGEAIFWLKPASVLLKANLQGVSVDKIKGDSVRVYVNRKNYSRLFLSGIGSIRLEKKPMASKSTVSYRNYSSMIAYADSLQKKYPGILTVDTIGYSTNSRAILSLAFANKTVSKVVPQIMVAAAIHGDEPLGYAVLLQFADSLVNGYTAGAENIRKLIDSTKLFLIPDVNPDGLFFNNGTVSTSSTRYNANTVDLNRNYPDFVYGSSPDGLARQPETQAIMDFATQHNIVLSLAYHGGSEVVNYPWDCKYARHPDDTWIQKAAHVYADRAQSDGPSAYFTSVSDNGITDGYDWYTISGGQQDYMTGIMGSREFTIEITDNKWIDPAQLGLYWNYNKQALVNFCLIALTAKKGQLTDATTGLPVAGKVWLSDRDTANCATRTDANGYFFRFIDVSSPTFYATATGYSVSAVTPNDKTATPLQITLESGLNPSLGVENITGSSVSLYPTIFDNALTLSGNNEKSTVYFYDLNGRNIYTVTLQSGESSIAVPASFPRGLCIARVVSASGTSVFKLVKE